MPPHVRAVFEIDVPRPRKLADLIEQVAGLSPSDRTAVDTLRGLQERLHVATDNAANQAETLRLVQEQGRDVFYKGEAARAIVAKSKPKA